MFGMYGWPALAVWPENLLHILEWVLNDRTDDEEWLTMLLKSLFRQHQTRIKKISCYCNALTSQVGFPIFNKYEEASSYLQQTNFSFYLNWWSHTLNW